MIIEAKILLFSKCQNYWEKVYQGAKLSVTSSVIKRCSVVLEILKNICALKILKLLYVPLCNTISFK